MACGVPSARACHSPQWRGRIGAHGLRLRVAVLRLPRGAEAAGDAILRPRCDGRAAAGRHVAALPAADDGVPVPPRTLPPTPSAPRPQTPTHAHARTRTRPPSRTCTCTRPPSRTRIVPHAHARTFASAAAGQVPERRDAGDSVSPPRGLLSRGRQFVPAGVPVRGAASADAIPRRSLVPGGHARAHRGPRAAAGDARRTVSAPGSVADGHRCGRHGLSSSS